jgi:hypothetical protein
MPRQLLAILVLSAVCAQALFGGFGSGVAICFGSDHAQCEVEVADESTTGCGHSCDHREGLPTPIPNEIPDHDQNCPCTDVELELTDLLVVLRNVDDLPLHMLSVPFDRPTYESVLPITQRCPAGSLYEDPGGAYRLAIVRSTRMLL